MNANAHVDGKHVSIAAINANTENSVVHGGDLEKASQLFGIDYDQWLDLSTGINPQHYPIPKLDEASFVNLPYPSVGFKKAVSKYYGGGDFVASHGSQPVIDLLPDLLPSAPILLPNVGYQEHYHAWSRNHDVMFYDALDLSASQKTISDTIAQYAHRGSPCHVLLINPNNPTGLSFSTETIYHWADRMGPDSYLIIDEAFIDLHPNESVLNQYDEFKRHNNLIVMRSFGKFFGLGGLRVGFTFTNSVLCKILQNRFGAWCINGPAQVIVEQALQDQAWQLAAREQIKTDTHWLVIQLSRLPQIKKAQCMATGLFHSYLMPSENAETLFLTFAQQAVLTRVIHVDSKQSILRIGLVPEAKRHTFTAIIDDMY